MSAPAQPARPEQPAKAGIGGREFIVLIAALTSIVAFSIDSMLPALPVIGADFALADQNDRQFVLIAFVLAFGPAQIVFGPLSDRFGRRPVLLGGLVFFVLASFGAAVTESWAALLSCRAAQGVGAAAVRITTLAIVRDCFAGRDMARIMSYVFTIFMLIPIVAPAMGQAIVAVTDWHWLFAVLGASGAALGLWSWVRMRETLPVAARRPLDPGSIFHAFREILTNRIALGYTLAVTLFFGGLFAFIVSIQQIIEVIYGMQDWFAAVFATSASAMAVASLGNASLVRRLGMRRISHAALVSFTVLGGILLIAGLLTVPPFLVTIGLISLIMMSFGFVAGNFNALAMEPLGHVAGSASSVLGTISFTGGALLGTLTGQAFNGTIVPLATAYFLFGLLGLAIVLITEKGELFAVHHDPAD
ncbi:multidrug effflux MFS transporter [Oceaniradius stylonematis]|jgi:DHA1 family bicyclomycin/chloramphenicol resistance-like MFS transporter|uniref:multidrug effflux MFS transporter n=1 Tax=Oceaniradius stylonematis TaxID=2184161 RepID=UPI00273E537F|nr:multidrug effflux MFS transporter [Oceaniradius stylonematis]